MTSRKQKILPQLEIERALGEMDTDCGLQMSWNESYK